MYKHPKFDELIIYCIIISEIAEKLNEKGMWTIHVKMEFYH